MKARRNAEVVIAWLGKGPSTTLAGIVEAGLMSHREAADAVRYAVQHGAMEPVRRPSEKANERRLYLATGRALPELAPPPSGPSFDGLLIAWGIMQEPMP
jgi:hypothetical protein